MVKNGGFCPALAGKKIEKMADFCGFTGVFVPGGVVFGGFLGSGVGDYRAKNVQFGQM